MKKFIEASKKIIDEQEQISRKELEKFKIELAAKSWLFMTTTGLMNAHKYSA